MATGMHMDERSVDCLVLCHHDQYRKVSAKSVTMRAMTLCKNLSGYRELLLTSIVTKISESLKATLQSCCMTRTDFLAPRDRKSYLTHVILPRLIVMCPI